MSWVGAVWLAFLVVLGAFVTSTHTELFCQNGRGETTFAGRGYILWQDPSWISVEGSPRRLVSGESCLQSRAVGR
jgi:hypothetical protein